MVQDIVNVREIHLNGRMLWFERSPSSRPSPSRRRGILRRHLAKSSAHQTCPALEPDFPLLGDLSRLGSGERNSAKPKVRQGPSERARASHWVRVREVV